MTRPLGVAALVLAGLVSTAHAEPVQITIAPPAEATTMDPGRSTQVLTVNYFVKLLLHGDAPDHEPGIRRDEWNLPPLVSEDEVEALGPGATGEDRTDGGPCSVRIHGVRAREGLVEHHATGAQGSHAVRETPVPVRLEDSHCRHGHGRGSSDDGSRPGRTLGGPSPRATQALV